jgi:ribosomal protein S18 acetylase RimI-like enzyme
VRPAIVPFAEEHLEDAAGLLAPRHREHRTAEPLLSPRFETAAGALPELQRAWAAEGASGAAALQGGKLVGYLFGAPRPGGHDPNLWVEAEGHAVSEAELVRDLYAAAAARWVEEGRTRHAALVPASEHELVDAWFRLSFGHQQAHGLRTVSADAEADVPAGYSIRPPVPEDIEELIAVDLALPAHQKRSPVFAEFAPYTREDSREEWERTLAAGEEVILAGFHGDRPVAAWSVVTSELSRHYGGLMRVDDACYLSFASTVPDARGSGIGVALTEASVARAAADGYSAMWTDWRVTNLLASRFWPRRGFRPAFIRLYRSIP